MIIVAVSDIHGTPLGRLEREVLSTVNPDLVVCLGDYDQTKTIRELIELEKRQKAIVLPGNHEHSLFNNISIESGTMAEEGKTFQQLYQELHDDPMARDYVQNLLRAPKREFYANGQHIILMHGALDGNLLNAPENLAGTDLEMWRRLFDYNTDPKIHADKTVSYHDANFAAMARQGFTLMLRGHDETPCFAYKDPNEGVVVKEGHGDHPILPNRLHAVTIGDYFDGNYAVIDISESKSKVTLKKF